MGKVELVCSERRHRPDGRRKYLACARQTVTGYRMRWAVEVFQSQDIKFSWDCFFFLVGRHRLFFKGQHVVHFDCPILIHDHLFHEQLDHRLTILEASTLDIASQEGTKLGNIVCDMLPFDGRVALLFQVVSFLY